MNILYKRIYSNFIILAPHNLQEQFEAIKEDTDYITNVIVICGIHECKKKTKHLQINDQIILKIERDPKKPPITDLSFYYLEIHNNKLKLEQDLTICTIQENDQYQHYQNGNLDFTYDLSKNFGYQIDKRSALVMCYKTDPLENPWNDIILLQKNQQPPEGFKKLPQSIQNQFLAYTLGNTCYTHQYNVEITDSYPSHNVQNEISIFCFPNGIQLYRQIQQPKYHNFIMTSETGVRSYCTALIFCEQNIKGYHEMAIILQSKYNYTEQTLELLKNLYQIYLSKNILPLERYISNIVDEIVMPQDSTETYIYHGAKKIYFFESNSFPLCSNQAFQCLFAVLSKKNIILLYFSLLLEKKIQLISSKPVISSLIIEALLTLIYPFEYTHILISNLPKELEQYLEAPLPYLIGINKQQAELYPDALQVYLDSNHIKQHKQIDISEDMFDKFVLKLKPFDKFFNPQLIDTIDYAFPIPKEDCQDQLDQYEIREIFLRFNIYLLQDYQKYIEKPIFKEKLFLKSKQKIKSFMEPFMQTRLFTYFIQVRMELSQNDLQLEYFDDCLKNPNGDHFTLPVQKFNDYLRPNDEGFLKDQAYKYTNFPLKLNYDFFTKPRLAFLKHEDSFCIQFHPKTPIEFLKHELSNIYQKWFKLLVDKIHENNINLMDYVKFSINLLKEMEQNNLYIESDIFKYAMIACAYYQMNELALEFITQMRKLGYQRYIQIYQYYFQTLQNNKKAQFRPIHQKNNSLNQKSSRQSSDSNRKENNNFFLEAKCPKCGRNYKIEDIFSSFIGDKIQCKSSGTLGCNFQFYAQLFYQEKQYTLFKPSKSNNQIVDMFYFYLLGLPYQFIINQNDENIVYIQKKKPIYIDYGCITDDAEIYEVDLQISAVHEVFGMFLQRITSLIQTQHIPQQKQNIRHMSEMSD